MKTSFSHIAFLVPSAERSAAVLQKLGFETDEPETFESEGTKEIYVGNYSAQRGLLLLVEAISPGAYTRALAKRGPSLHHLAIDVPDIAKFLPQVENLGWKLHPATAETMQHKTAWLYLKGIPTLIEVHQKKELSTKPLMVSSLELPIEKSKMELFEGLGLGELISPSSKEISFTVDGQKLSFTSLCK